MHILNFAGNILVFCTSPMFLRVSGAQVILAAVGVKKGYIIIDIQAACKRKMTKITQSINQEPAAVVVHQTYPKLFVLSYPECKKQETPKR